MFEEKYASTITVEELELMQGIAGAFGFCLEAGFKGFILFNDQFLVDSIPNKTEGIENIVPSLLTLLNVYTDKHGDTHTRLLTRHLRVTQSKLLKVG